VKRQDVINGALLLALIALVLLAAAAAGVLVVRAFGGM